MDMLGVLGFVLSLIGLVLIAEEKWAHRHRIRVTLAHQGHATGSGQEQLLVVRVTSEFRPCTVDNLDVEWLNPPPSRPGLSFGWKSIGSAMDPSEFQKMGWEDAGFARQTISDGETRSWVIQPMTSDAEFASMPREMRVRVTTTVSNRYGRGTRIVYSDNSWFQPRLT